MEIRYIFNPEPNVKMAWNTVIQDYINKGEAPTDILSNHVSTLYWWRNLNKIEKNEISQKIESFISGAELVNNIDYQRRTSPENEKNIKHLLAYFNSPTVISNITIVFFGLLVIVGLVSVASDYSLIEFINKVIAGGYYTLEEANSLDATQATTAIWYLIFYISASISFLFWIYRVYKNLTFLGNDNLRHSPGWAVGWFFIPIFSLWKPYQVMQEIWKGSSPNIQIKNPESWRYSKGSYLIPIWWIFHLLSAIVGTGMFRLGYSNQFYDETLEGLLTNAWATLALDVVDVLGATLLIFIIWNIRVRQQQRYHIFLNSDSNFVIM